MKRITMFVLMASLTIAIVHQPVHSADNSRVIGRITGTHQELPGYFRNNPILLSSGPDEVEFTGFRLVRESDGKRFLIRPNHDGYFQQDLPGGSYTLLRKRADRPAYREPKTIKIMAFVVPPDTLVNLGTINLVIFGKPTELLFSLRNWERGKYIYRYGYEREQGDGAYEKPLNWFQRKSSKAAAGMGDRTVNVDTGTTSVKDGSKVVIEIHPRQFKD